MTRIACVLFDLDSVLVDATEWHYEALNRALRLFGFDLTRCRPRSFWTRRSTESLC